VIVADTWDEAACRARLAATTPLPWQYYGDVICGVTARCHCSLDHARSFAVAMEPDRPHEAHDIVSGVAECDVDDETIPDFEQYKRDLQFIAHAPADLGAALAALDAARAKIDEADGVIAAATAAITRQLDRAVTAERECDRLRARLEECRLTGAGESDAVAELLQLRSERDHWQRKWAEGRDEIDRLRAALAQQTAYADAAVEVDDARRLEIDRLRAALAPFAGAVILPGAPDHGWLAGWVDDPTMPTIADCRRAAAVLGGR
jgi:hypothetical protein